MKIAFSVKDPDGIYDFLNDRILGEPVFSEEDKEYLLSTYFEFSDYLNLEYDTETKALMVCKFK